MKAKMTYADGILEAHRHLLKNHQEFFVMGQGVTSPWYVGNTMKDLDKEFGSDRIIDTPVSEDAVTSIAFGASLLNHRVVVVHPRMDFMILACNALVNQIANWGYLFGSQGVGGLTIRAIINRGGEQGAQHSQSLQSWFAHVPGLRVVMPFTAIDARDLFVKSVLCPDPVLYIDDRWLYQQESEWQEIDSSPLYKEGPRLLRGGADLTLVGSGFSTHLCLKAADHLEEMGISCEVCDLRILNPLDARGVIESVRKTGRLLVVDGGWRTCGMAGEIIARVSERVAPGVFRNSPKRITLPDCPAPASSVLERAYYPNVRRIVNDAKKMYYAPTRKGRIAKGARSAETSL